MNSLADLACAFYLSVRAKYDRYQVSLSLSPKPACNELVQYTDVADLNFLHYEELFDDSPLVAKNI